MKLVGINYNVGILRLQNLRYQNVTVFMALKLYFHVLSMRFWWHFDFLQKAWKCLYEGMKMWHAFCFFWKIIQNIYKFKPISPQKWSKIRLCHFCQGLWSVKCSLFICFKIIKKRLIHSIAGRCFSQVFVSHTKYVHRSSFSNLVA